MRTRSAIRKTVMKLPLSGIRAAVPVFLALSMIGLTARPTTGQANPKFKVLVLGLPDSNHPQTGAAGIKAVQELSAGQDYTVDASTDYSKVNDATLANYQVILSVMAWQGEMPAASQQAFQKFIESGKGWMGFHTSTLAGIQSPAWAWYDTWVGGITFKGHPATRMNGTVKQETDAASHPVLQGVPASFSIHEEWYAWNKSPRAGANIKVLATVDESSYQPAGTAMGADHPVLWSNTKYGPMMLTSLGHEPEAFSNANLRKLIANAIPWLAKSTVTAVSPTLQMKAARTAPAALRWDGHHLTAVRSAAPEAPLDAMGRSLGIPARP
jgi:uncharacterized protein